MLICLIYAEKGKTTQLRSPENEDKRNSSGFPRYPISPHLLAGPTIEEKRQTLVYIIRTIQREVFGDEIKQLIAGREVTKAKPHSPTATHSGRRGHPKDQLKVTRSSTSSTRGQTSHDPAEEPPRHPNDHPLRAQAAWTPRRS